MLELARVVATHPESNSVDCVLVSDGRRIPGVRVTSPFASTHSGVVDLPSVELGQSTDPATAPLGSREIFAVLAFVQGTAAVCLGFLYPQVNQLAFTDKNRRITRHVSGVYSTTDETGDTEWYHPSGTYVRLGETPDHEDLTGKDFDKLWQVPGSDRAVSARVTLANHGAAKVTLTIDPDGNITLQTVGNLAISADGSVSLSAQSMTVDCPSTAWTGDIDLDGTLTASEDVLAQIVSLFSHVHSGIMPGAGVSGVPVGGGGGGSGGGSSNAEIAAALVAEWETA
jgi:phage baseplate assembly protein gpV